VALICAACAENHGSGKSMTEAKSKSAPAAKVNPAEVQAMAKAPTPPASATRQSSIGKGKTAVKSANAPGDTDSYWVMELDIDGDGMVEETSLLWDDEDKVLLAYAETDVPCQWGGTAAVSLLVGVNGKGNTRGMPEGSGFYAVYFDATECAAEAAGLYGCKFDARGNATACGAAVLDEATDTVAIVEVE
jgi:hypothetical protein